MNTDKSRKTDWDEEKNPEKEPVVDRVTASSKKGENTANKWATNWHINTLEDDVSCVDIHNDVHIDATDMANTLPCRVNGIKEYSLSDETVLYTPEPEMAHSLNSSAKAIWELCNGSHTIVEISQKLGKRLGCSGTDLLSDVTTTITKLQKLSLLELKNVPRTKST